MLILFDLDGTLISSYMEDPDRNYHRWRVLPERREKLSTLLAEGHRLGIATNQGGVGLGFLTEGSFWRKMTRVLVALELPTDSPVAVCFAYPNSKRDKYRDPGQLARRKPAPGMLTELRDAFADVAAQGTLYVGDRQEDKQAALAAGIQFQFAEDFFAD